MVHIGKIIFLPETRGIGASRLQCEKLIDQKIRSTGAVKINFRVCRDNNTAWSLYSSLGF